MSDHRPPRLIARIAAVASAALDGNLRGAQSVAATLPTDGVELTPAEEQLRVAVVAGDTALADAWARVVQRMLASSSQAEGDVVPMTPDGVAVGTVYQPVLKQDVHPAAALAADAAVAPPATAAAARATDNRPRRDSVAAPRIWTETCPERTGAFHRGAVTAVASAAGGVFTCGADGRVLHWDIQANTARGMKSSYTGNVLSCAVARDGLTVASGSADGKVRVWEARTCRKTHTMHGHTGKVHSVAFAPDGAHLASTCTSVRVWRTVDGECVAVMKPEPKGSTSYCCGFSNTDGGQWLVAGGGQQRLVAWNWRRPAHEGGSTRRIGGHTSAVWSCSYNAADTWVVSSSLDQTAQVSDAVSGAVLRTFACVAPVVSAMFLGDGSTHVVSCGRDHVVRLWEISTQRTIGTFEGHAKAVFGMAWHGSAHLVTCGEDGTCCLWKLPDSILFDSRRDQPGTR